MIDFDFAETTLVATQTLSEIASYNINNNDAQKSLILTRVSMFDLGEIDSSLMQDVEYEYVMGRTLRFGDYTSESPLASGNVDECIGLSTDVYDESGENPLNTLTAIGVGATLNFEDMYNTSITSPVFAIFGRVQTRYADGSYTLGDELTLCTSVQVNRYVTFGHALASKLRFLMHWNNTLFRRPDGVEVVAEYKSQYLSTQTFQSWLDKYNLNGKLDYDYVKRNMSMYASVYETPNEAMLLSVDRNRFRLRSAKYYRYMKTSALLSHQTVRFELNIMSSVLDDGEYSEPLNDINYYEYMFVLKVLEDSNGNVCLACFYNPLAINHTKCGSPVAYKNCKLFVIPPGSSQPVVRDLRPATFEILNEGDGDYAWKNLYLPSECLVGGITKDGLTFTVRGLDIEYFGMSDIRYYYPSMQCYWYIGRFADGSRDTWYLCDKDRSYYTSEWNPYSGVHNDGNSIFWKTYDPENGNAMFFKEARRDGKIHDYIVQSSQSDVWHEPATCACRIVLNGNVHPVLITQYNVIVFDISPDIDGTNDWDGNRYQITESSLSGLFNYMNYIDMSRNVIGCQSCGSNICIQQVDITDTSVVWPYYFSVLNSNGYSDDLGMTEDISLTLDDTCAGQTSLYKFGMVGIGNGGSMLGVSAPEISYSGGRVDISQKYCTFTIKANEHFGAQTVAFATKDSYQLRYRFPFNSNTKRSYSVTILTNGNLGVISEYPTYFEYEKVDGVILPI